MAKLQQQRYSELHPRPRLVSLGRMLAIWPLAAYALLLHGSRVNLESVRRAIGEEWADCKAAWRSR